MKRDFIIEKKTIDAISYVNIISKIQYNSMHVLLLLKSKNKTFLKLHHEYFLFEKHNRKLSIKELILFLSNVA